MAVATYTPSRAVLPPSPVERLRSFGPLPPLTFTGVTFAIGALVLALGGSPFVLVGGILGADIAVLAFFLTRTAWKLFGPLA